jgi:hypothetical protein
MVIDGREIARVSRYDERGGFDSGDPDWILVQRSPLVLYSSVPQPVERTLMERYELVRTFPTGGEGLDRVYDQQDAFFLPLGGLGGVARPGPAFELYRKRADVIPVR